MKYTIHFQQINYQAITVEALDEDEAVFKASQIWAELNPANVEEIEKEE